MDSFWDEILATMRATGIPCDRTNAFIILGIRANDQPVSPEGAGMLAIAWRCLYAEVTASRVEERGLDLNKALRRTLAMVISRVKAYGEKWNLWYRKTRLTSRHRKVAVRYQNYKLIKLTDEADYEVSQELTRAFDQTDT